MRRLLLATRPDPLLPAPLPSPSSETLSESASLPEPTRHLAALLLAKLYFHLGAHADALTFALRSGPRFEQARTAVVSGRGAAGDERFVEVVTAKALDTYVALRSSSSSSSSPPAEDAKTVAALEQILQSIVAHALSTGGAHHALGLALEARRADLVRFVWEHAGRDGGVLRWVLDVVGSGGRGEGGRQFRTEVRRPSLGRRQLPPLPPSR